MASSKLTKLLFGQMTKLKLLDRDGAEGRFRLEKSPFDGLEDPDDFAADKREEFSVIGLIFPKSEIYGERSYRIELKLTREYPMEPPVVRFLTTIFHLNVEENGIFCSVLLEKTAKYTPDTSLAQVVKTVVDCIDRPDLEYAISLTMGTEYKDHRDEFNRKALEYVKKYGLPRQ